MIDWNRRRVLTAGAGLIGTVAMPAVVRAQQGEAIKIGHLAPRTGVGAVQGEGMYKGAVLAVEDINKKGGDRGVQGAAPNRAGQRACALRGND